MTTHDHGGAASPAAPRSLLRAVAVPAEHGGWGLTLEPVLLGLLVAPSVAGGALGLAALTAFLARTPAKLALADRRRRRRAARTAVAERVATVELLALAALLTVAATTASGPFWVPLLVAAPMFGLELWFEVRSRGRRLAPELAGAVGVSSFAAAIALADDRAATLAFGLWLVLAARVVASVPFVREQIARLHARTTDTRVTDVTSVAAVALAAGAIGLDDRLIAGAAAALVVIAVQLFVLRRGQPPRAAVIGMQQLALGLAVVLVTAAGVVA